MYSDRLPHFAQAKEIYLIEEMSNLTLVLSFLKECEFYFKL